MKSHRSGMRASHCKKRFTPADKFRQAQVQAQINRNYVLQDSLLNNEVREYSKEIEASSARRRKLHRKFRETYCAGNGSEVKEKLANFEEARKHGDEDDLESESDLMDEILEVHGNIERYKIRRTAAEDKLLTLASQSKKMNQNLSKDMAREMSDNEEETDQAVEGLLAGPSRRR